MPLSLSAYVILVIAVIYYY